MTKIRTFCILSALVLLTVFSACKSTETVDFDKKTVSGGLIVVSSHPARTVIHENDQIFMYASSAPSATAKITFKVESGNAFMDNSHIEQIDFILDKKEALYAIQLTFTDYGSKLFAEITEKNVGKSLHICVDGVSITAPTIYAKITDGKAVISGTNTYEQVEDMYKLLTQ